QGGIHGRHRLQLRADAPATGVSAGPGLLAVPLGWQPAGRNALRCRRSLPRDPRRQGEAMTWIVPAMLLLVALIHLLPLAGLLGVAKMEGAYGVRIEGPD